jgi:crotonobetainyl-CoA:carnitine CoA-transferase CaiB-like acyl-CoA transferase
MGLIVSHGRLQAATPTGLNDVDQPRTARQARATSRAASGAQRPFLCHAPHDREHPANAALNVYRASDGTLFVLVVTPDKLAAVAKAIGRPA